MDKQDPNRTRADIPRDQVFSTYHDWHTAEALKALEAEHDCVIREVYTEGATNWFAVRWTIVFDFGPKGYDDRQIKRVAFLAAVNLFPGVYKPSIWVEDRDAGNPRAATCLVRWFAGGAAAVARTPDTN